MKEKNKINKTSIFLYSFGIAFIEYLLLDLVLSDIVITDYKMEVTIGLILDFLIIGFVTIVYMTDTFLKDYKDVVLSSKINIVFSVIGIVSIILLAYIFLNKVIIELKIIPVLIISIGSFVLAKIIENK